MLKGFLPLGLLAVFAAAVAAACFSPVVSLGSDDAGSPGQSDAGWDAGGDAGIPDAGSTPDAGDGGPTDSGYPGDYTACPTFSALDRILIARNDVAHGRRVVLMVVNGDPTAGLGIGAPPGWIARHARIETAATGEYATSGSGEVRFQVPDAGSAYPRSLDVHVSLEFPSGTERLDAEGLVLDDQSCDRQGLKGSWSVVSGITQAVDFKGVFATSASEARMVGSANSAFRWDGVRWQQETLPISTMVQLEDVWASGPGDYWAVGNNISGFGVIFHLISGNWQPSVHSPSAHRLNAIWGSSANNLWTVGVSWGGLVDYGVSWNWDGTRWLFGTPGNQVTEPFLGISSSSPKEQLPGDFWLVHSNLPGSTLARYLPGGSGWNSVPNRAPANPTGGIWVRSAAPVDIWVTGDKSTMLHFDGSSWTMASTTGGTLRDIHAVAPDDAWAVGEGGALAHFDGIDWRNLPSPTKAALHSVHGTGPTDIWAVGAGGEVLHFGDGSQGELCGTNYNCQPGLLCCYPCGVSGCHQRCLAPAAGGGCPAFP